MGIRPNKSIGWGVTVKGTDLREKTLENALDHKSLSYAGLFDYMEQHNLMEEYKKAKFFQKEEFQKLDKKKTLFKYIEIISNEYDSEKDFTDQDWTIIFYPMVLSPLAFHDGSEEFKNGDGPFTYAEIEKFFPESLEELNTVSYAIDTPPFPSEYSVIYNTENKNTKNFKTLDDKSILQEVKRCLRSRPNDRFSSVYAQMLGFKNVEEVKEVYSLAPSEEIFAFAQYTRLFKDEKIPFELKPMVAYYWM